MAIIPISQFTSVPSVGPADIFILDQAGKTYKGTIAQILANTTLAGNSDVRLTNLQSGQVLTYTGPVSGWANQNPIATFSTLTDVDTSSKGAGKFLAYNSTTAKFDFEPVGFPFTIVQQALGMGGNASTRTATFSTLPTAGNTLYAFLGYPKNSTLSATPTGWTVVVNQGESGLYSAIALYSKLSDGTETGFTQTISTTDGITVTLFEIKGARTVDKLAIASAGAGVSFQVYPAIIPTPGSMLFFATSWTSSGEIPIFTGVGYKELSCYIYRPQRGIFGGIYLNPAPSSGFIMPQVYAPTYDGNTGPISISLSIL